MKKLIKLIKDFFKPDHRFTNRTEKQVLNTAQPLPPPPPLEYDYSNLSENAKRLYKLVEFENNLKVLQKNAQMLSSIGENCTGEVRLGFATLTIEYRSPYGRGIVWVSDDNIKAVANIALSSINSEINQVEQEIKELTESK